MDPTILFTYLKIILLQYFQFSVFSNNKLNPNGPRCVCVWRCIKLREVIPDKIDKVVQFLIPYRNIMASVLDSGITRLVVPLQVQ